ncbi:hypothetical protein J3Q64DRAFT_1023836 [Phycomyces blakesleeanus]|uniref:Nucleoside diphosphate kinase n=1 Tax=Phycomyces blakesleeanus TaxID=4837 RepID=A0ABR3BDW0_PHYBL
MHETDNTIEEIKSAGFDILHRRTHIQFTLEQAQILYRSQSNQKIKEELVLGLISGPVEGIILEKVDAINAWRIFAGLKNPADTESDHRVREKGVIYASTCVANISEDIELVLSASDVKAKDQAEEYKENKEEPAVGNESKDIKKEEINTSTSSTKPESPKHMESDPKVITVSKAEKVDIDNSCVPEL